MFLKASYRDRGNLLALEKVNFLESQRVGLQEGS